MTTTLNPKDQRRKDALDRYENDVMTGRRFALIAQSERSQIGYRPMMNPDTYGKALAIMADMAREGGPFAELASQAVRKINVYGTVHDMVAAVAESFAATMRNPYDDVAARTGPEPVRHSTAQREWNIRWRLIALVHLARLGWLTNAYVPGYGWALHELCERERVYSINRYAVTR